MTVNTRTGNFIKTENFTETEKIFHYFSSIFHGPKNCKIIKDKKISGEITE